MLLGEIMPNEIINVFDKYEFKKDNKIYRAAVIMPYVNIVLDKI